MGPPSAALELATSQNVASSAVIKDLIGDLRQRQSQRLRLVLDFSSASAACGSNGSGSPVGASASGRHVAMDHSPGERSIGVAGARSTGLDSVAGDAPLVRAALGGRSAGAASPSST